MDQTRPFALTVQQHNANRIYCLNQAAEDQGLHRGMGFADARAYCPDLHSQPADLVADQRFQSGLRRWATRYCPWVGFEAHDGLVLDVTGSSHLMGGEDQLADDMQTRLSRAGLSAKLGLGATRGEAWGLARYAKPGQTFQDLPIAALRLDEKTAIALQRLGLRDVRAVAQMDRAALTRRFGPDLLLRLDQALGQQAESITPESDPPHYAVRVTFPEPIGLKEDVLQGTRRLLERLCHKLGLNDAGVRRLSLIARRVDQDSQAVDLRLARAMRDADRILPLFERGLSELEAGYGIDQLRLIATQVEHLKPVQINHVTQSHSTQLDDLITRLGARIGLDNIQRLLPADSHIPERSFTHAPAAYSHASSAWSSQHPRPLRLFPPEPIQGADRRPPMAFRWRRMFLTVARVVGPERIMPEWWLPDEAWHTGMRDYWRVETQQGRRLWMFYTPQNPAWFVQGEFA